MFITAFQSVEIMNSIRRTYGDTAITKKLTKMELESMQWIASRKISQTLNIFMTAPQSPEEQYAFRTFPSVSRFIGKIEVFNDICIFPVVQPRFRYCGVQLLTCYT